MQNKAVTGWWVGPDFHAGRRAGPTTLPSSRRAAAFRGGGGRGFSLPPPLMETCVLICGIIQQRHRRWRAAGFLPTPGRWCLRYHLPRRRRALRGGTRTCSIGPGIFRLRPPVPEGSLPLDLSRQQPGASELHGWRAAGPRTTMCSAYALNANSSFRRRQRRLPEGYEGRSSPSRHVGRFR